ncbi:hypothetical protein FHS26_005512 [Rhizobium pisi]|uniref:Uncharacterized protein n=1 Tax=Rhizobium pisi TaxID=574561 RepID=A0A7W5G2A9_9HYPH|nr:hypothetical protein [Rhizobium pisi]
MLLEANLDRGVDAGENGQQRKHSPRTAGSGFFARSALPLCG